MATCVVARDPRVDAGAVLELWARACRARVNPMARSGSLAIAAVLDDLESQSFLAAALFNMSAGVAAATHMGTRVNGRGDDDPIEVSERSRDSARRLAEAAPDGQLLVSDDLGAFLSIARARFASSLERARLRDVVGAPVAAYRLRPGAPSVSPRAANQAPTTLDGMRRSQLVERLGSVLTPFLGPIAPLMLRRLPSGRMSAKEFVDAILTDVPLALYEPVKRAIEEEIRRLR